MPNLIRILFISAALFSQAAHAAEALPASDDPALERRVTAIAEELRCLVCQNQTIAESHAPLAIDLKNQIRDQVKGGASEAEVKDYMVKRYGDFVLYRPPLKGITLLLWFGPFTLLLAGFAFLFIYLRQRRKTQQEEAPLDDEQRARARQILDSGAKPE